MAEPDARAARRANAAEELAEIIPDPPALHANVWDGVGARFHLLAFDAGVDLGDPDDAATACAVLYALASTHRSLPLAISAAARTSVGQYREGIR